MVTSETRSLAAVVMTRMDQLDRSRPVLVVSRLSQFPKTLTLVRGLGLRSDVPRTDIGRLLGASHQAGAVLLRQPDSPRSPRCTRRRQRGAYRPCIASRRALPPVGRAPTPFNRSFSAWPANPRRFNLAGSPTRIAWREEGVGFASVSPAYDAVTARPDYRPCSRRWRRAPPGPSRASTGRCGRTVPACTARGAH
jgi:hypothetical protein